MRTRTRSMLVCLPLTLVAAILSLPPGVAAAEEPPGPSATTESASEVTVRTDEHTEAGGADETSGSESADEQPTSKEAKAALLATPSAAPPAASCTALPVAAWGAGHSDTTAGPDGVACFAVTPSTTGSHVVWGAVADYRFVTIGVLRPDDSVVRSIPVWNGADAAPLEAGTTYRIVVEGLPGGSTFSASVHDLGASGCSAVAPVWDTAVSTATLATGSETQCREVAAGPGHTLRLSGMHRWQELRVYDAAGTRTCGFREDGRCTLSGPGPWRVVTHLNLFEFRANAVALPATTETWIGDYADPTGCATAPLGAWGAAPPIHVTRGSGAWDCQAVTTTTSGTYVHRVDGRDWLTAELRGPTGATPPTSPNGHSARATVHTLDASTTYLHVVTGRPFANQGHVPDYWAGVYRVAETTGCAGVAASAWNATSPAGTWSIPSARQLPCHRLQGATGDHLRLNTVTGSVLDNPGLQVSTDVFDASGAWVCGASTGYASTDCTLTGAGPWQLVTSTHWHDGAGARTGQLWINDYGDTTGCAPGPLATWGAPLPLTGTLGPSATRCRLVTPTTTGVHVGRTTLPTKDWGPLGEVRSTTGELKGTFTYTGLGQATLTAGEPYLVLAGINGAMPTAPADSLSLGVYDLNATAGCAELSSTRWDAAPANLSLGDGHGVDCRRIPALAGDTVRVQHSRPDSEFNGLQTQVLNSLGQAACGQIQHASANRLCDLTGPGPWRTLTQYSPWDDPDPPSTARVSVAKIAPDPADGCLDDIGTTISMSAPLAELTRSTNTQECHRLDFATGDRIWVHGYSPIGARDVRLSVIDSRGFEICWSSGGGGSFGDNCSLGGEAPYRLVVTSVSDADNSGLAYTLGARRLNDPVGCTKLPHPATGLPAQTGTLTSNPGTRCYTVDGGVNDRLRLKASHPTTAGLHYGLDVFGPGGATVGRKYPGTAQQDFVLGQDGQYAVVVGRFSQAPGPFRLEGTCVNTPCGTGGLRIDTATAELGQAREVTLTVNGKGLLDGSRVELVQGDTVLVGSGGAAAATGLSTQVRFDTRGRLGAFGVRITNPDGETNTLPTSVQIVEATQPFVTPVVDMTANLAAGRTRNMRVHLYNEGNVDAFAVPLLFTVPENLGFAPVTGMVKAEDGSVVPTTFTPASMAIPGGPGTVRIPFIVGRVPAGADVTMSFSVTGYDGGAGVISVGSGCGLVQPDDGFTWSGCGGSMWGAFKNFIPFSDCAALASDVWTNTYGLLSGSATLSSAVAPMEVLWDGGGCILDIIAPGAGSWLKVMQELMDAFDHVKAFDQVIRKCLGWHYHVYGVTSSRDPNAVVGPSGGGPDRAMTGDGTHRYAVYFENMAAATGPAQEVRISSELDPTIYDLSTLRFTGLAFGDFEWRAEPAAATHDELLDLARADGLRLRSTASMTAGGHLEWFLQSIDPVTGALPEDALMGFLPPNVDGTQGQGVVFYEVALKQPTSGQVVSNQASIVFDVNEPIETNTWSNLVDRDPPSAAVSTPATTADPSIPLVLGGSDPTSGIAAYDIFVSTDGGPAKPWRSEVPPGPVSYPGTAGHSYAFRAVATDHAGNTSTLSSPATTAVTSSVTPPPPPPSTVTPTPTAGPTTAPTTAPTPLPSLTVRTRPVVKGKAKVGKTLKATAGTWSLPVQVGYQWLANGKAIKKANRNKLRLTRKHRGKRISLRVTATAGSGSPVTVVIKVKGKVR